MRSVFRKPFVELGESKQFVHNVRRPGILPDTLAQGLGMAGDAGA
jgi:hypothetical protein